METFAGRRDGAEFSIPVINVKVELLNLYVIEYVAGSKLKKVQREDI